VPAQQEAVGAVGDIFNNGVVQCPRCVFRSVNTTFDQKIDAYMLIYAQGETYEDALQVVVLCAPHITFIAHLHVLAKYIVCLRSHGVVCVRRRSQGKVVWKRELFGDPDEWLETKSNTYVVSSQVGKAR